jgi:plasmid stabilization system protein ParE
VTPTLELLDEALEEIEEASRWYERRSPSAAIGFTDAIDAAVAQIHRLPLAWSPYAMDTRRYVLRGYPYYVVYRADPSRVVIIAVAHTSRRPGYWHSRLDDL